MKIEEMILVTDNNKGSETNYLASFEDYLEVIKAAYPNSVKDMADAVAALYDTKQKPEDWSEIYFMSNKTSYARFCNSESQLRGFLLGTFNETNEEKTNFTFDEGRCSKKCFEVLRAYDIKPDGHSLMGSFVYQNLDHAFQTGEIIHNMNGSDYRILEVLAPDNLLLLSQNTGEICVGVGTQLMAKYPKGEERTSHDSILTGVSWSHGIYLGKNIRAIDFDKIQKMYGRPEKIESLGDYRNSLKKTFSMYQKIMENETLTAEVREAATNSIYTEFGTGREQAFLDSLEDGKYDGGFHGRSAERKEKSR